MKKILSIQSHVAYGYVGNRAAVFPLQRLGHDVWAINTVQFSNHTGYGAWTGEVFGSDHIESILNGIEARDVLSECDAVLSGYMGSAKVGESILHAVTHVRSANTNALYCCDPVMGDVGRGFFVAPGLPEFIRDRAMPLANVITPNQFELEYLVNLPIMTLEDALMATAKAREKGPKIVLMTSLVRSDAPAGRIETLVDTEDGAWLTSTPKLDFDPPPNGAGDAVAALFLAKLLETGSAAAALEHATAAIFAVLLATKSAGTRELALVQAQDELISPTHRFAAQKVRST